MSQSKGELNSDKQILYLVQWFAEFSEFQRQDFLSDHLSPVYDGRFFQIKLFGNQSDQTTTNGSSSKTEEDVTNGISSISLESGDRPPSIFQCRMKLFKEWFQDQWSDQDRVEFLLRLKNIDSEFVMDFYRRLLQRHQLLDRELFSSMMAAASPDKQQLVDRLDLLNPAIFKSSALKAADLTQNGFGNHSDDKRQPDLLANCGGAANTDSSLSSSPGSSIPISLESTGGESQEPAQEPEPEVIIEPDEDEQQPFDQSHLTIITPTAPDLLT